MYQYINNTLLWSDCSQRNSRVLPSPMAIVDYDALFSGLSGRRGNYSAMTKAYKRKVAVRNVIVM